MRTNLIYNPSFETNVTDNVAIENNGSGSPIKTRDSAKASFGTYSCKVAFDATGQTESWRVKLRMNDTNTFSIVNGTTYYVSAYVASSDSRSIQIAMEEAGGASGYYSSTTATTPTMARMSFTFTAVADKIMTLNLLGNTGNAGDVWIDGVMVEISSTSGTYFDGSSTDTIVYDYAWSGTAHNSTSTQTVTAPVFFEIDSTDRTLIVDWKSVKREQVLSKESDKLSFLIRKHNGQTYKPTAGNEVVLTINGNKEFGGYIVEMDEDIEGRVEYIKCTCKDYTHDLDRQLVSKTYEAMTVNAIIADLIGTFATGITGTAVNCPVVIDSVTFNYLPISRCLTRLTELVDGFDWYIDYDKDIHFFETALVASAFDLTDTSGNYAYNSLSIREDTHQLRNEVIIRGGLLTSSTLRTEFASGDGTKDVFPLATKFANLPTVTISAVNKTVGVENIDGTGFDCYWNYNEKSLKFTTPPAAGTSNIAVTEYPQYPLILQKRNESSITTYGVFQHVIVDKNIRDLETAGLRADVELLRYSNPEKTANFLTYTSGLMTGQTINVQSTIRGIDEDFKIQSIRSYLRTPDTDELTHEVECVTAEDLGINDILARLLITNPSDQIEIQEGEFIERIRQLTESFTVTDSTPTNSKTSGPFLYGTAIMGRSTWA